MRKTQEDPELVISGLETYFKNLLANRNNTQVRINLESDREHTWFEVSLSSKERGFTGSFPQRRISLEKHKRIGHKGIHLQIHYHLIENTAEIGRLYIHLDIQDSVHLQDIAEGFIFALYELLEDLGGDYRDMIEDIFFPELVSELVEKKAVLQAAVEDGYSKKGIEIRSYQTNESRLITPEEIRELVRTRSELAPLIGNLAGRNL